MTNPRGADQAMAKARWLKWRASSMWSLVVGFGLLFLGASISANMMFGGVAMVGVGMLGLLVCAIALRRHREDPWHDRDIDAWEKDEMSARDRRV